MDFPAIDALCHRPEAYAEGPAWDRLFVAAMDENLRFQLERQPYLRHLAAEAGLQSGLASLEDVDRLPPLFVGTMKLHAFRSIEASDVALCLTSSGTGGQRTQTFFDAASLARLQALAQASFEAIGFRGTRPVRAFIASYDPDHAATVGTSWSDAQMLALAPCLEQHWMIRWDEAAGAYQFDAEGWARLLLEGDQPVRFLGFPAFIAQLVQEALRLQPGFRVHPDSFVLAGGGWKNHQGTPMSHAAFARFLEDAIGLPAANVRDTYGMAEHGVPYNACRLGRHHVPVYGRLRVLDPMTLAPRADGEEGVLQLLTPYNTAQPSLSVLSTDLAVLGRDCPCGLPGRVLAAVRRGGLRKHRGCAIAAQEILDRSRAAAAAAEARA